MSQPRTLPLFDPDAQPQSWNERMVPGEYAVLYSLNQSATSGPTCTLFPTLLEAEQHAADQVAIQPTLRCRIYDHNGLGRQPIREFRGAQHKGESEITARFRRWGGSIFLFGGLALFGLDAVFDSSLTWPGILAARMIPVGLILLVMEFGIVAEARRKARRAQSSL